MRLEDGLTQTKRYERCASRIFAPLEIMPLASRAFAGDVRSLVEGPISIAKAVSTPHRAACRTPLKRSAALIWLQLSGRAEWLQHGRWHQCEAGQMGAIDATEAFDLRFPVDAATLTIAMPTAARYRPSSFDRVGRGTSIVDRLLATLLQEMAADDADPAHIRGALEVLSPMVDAVLSGGQLDIEADRVRMLLRSRVAEEVSLNEIAQHMAMSPRTLQRRLRQSGDSFNDILRSVRIETVSAQLRQTNIGVGQIALNAGFNDLSNFNRVFRSIKGCSPTEFRRRVRST